MSYSEIIRPPLSFRRAPMDHPQSDHWPHDAYCIQKWQIICSSGKLWSVWLESKCRLSCLLDCWNDCSLRTCNNWIWQGLPVSHLVVSKVIFVKSTYGYRVITCNFLVIHIKPNSVQLAQITSFMLDKNRCKLFVFMPIVKSLAGYIRVVKF